MTEFKFDATEERILDWLEIHGYRVDVENHTLIPPLTFKAQDNLIEYLKEKEKEDGKE